MKLALLLFGLATAAVFNRDAGKGKIKRHNLLTTKIKQITTNTMILTIQKSRTLPWDQLTQKL